MDDVASRGPLRYLQDVPDPRAANVRHRLLDLLVLSLLAMLCRCEDFDEIALWAQEREDWLKTFLPLPHGIPHPDTFERLFRRLDPQALERCLIQFTQAVARHSAGRLVALDGKSLRRSFDQGGRTVALHLVNAWDQTNGLVLGQLATELKSNEITAVPKLLELLDLKGCVVSLDAMHCQKATAQAILDRRADYLLALKDNQKTFHEDVKLFFEESIAQGDGQLTALPQPLVESEHGRLETRRLWASHEVNWLKQQGHDWPQLRGMVCVECERHTFADAKTSITRRYFLTSLDPRKVGAERLLALVRGHWSIENQLHWSLDVSFREDACRVRKDHGARNLAALRRLALNLVRRYAPPKGRYGSPSDSMSLKRRRLLCSLNPDFLLQTLLKP